MSTALAVTLFAAPCRANSLEVCDRPSEPSAGQKDVMLRFGAIVRSELDASGHDMALIARSGLDLHRLDVRYSHEGIVLRGDGDPSWSVRELYYACDEKKPRLFDEGLASFLLGTDDPQTSWASVVLLPPAASAAVRRSAVDKRQALRLLSATYSANAYAFDTRFQNCNQWVIELLAQAWGADTVDVAEGVDSATRDAEAKVDTDTDTDTETDAARLRAQRWLIRQNYQPTVFTVSMHPMTLLADVIPWISNADHPPAELAANRYNVSMPSSIETFVQAKVPGAQRIEVCHVGRHVVIHHGWDDIADGCIAGPADRVVELTND